MLRLGRFEEAIDAFKLCEHGFTSVEDLARAENVANSIRFAQDLAADEDGR